MVLQKFNTRDELYFQKEFKVFINGGNKNATFQSVAFKLIETITIFTVIREKGKTTQN